MNGLAKPDAASYWPREKLAVARGEPVLVSHFIIQHGPWSAHAHKEPERCICKVNNGNKNMFVTCAPVSFVVL